MAFKGDAYQPYGRIISSATLSGGHRGPLRHSVPGSLTDRGTGPMARMAGPQPSKGGAHAVLRAGVILGVMRRLCWSSTDLGSSAEEETQNP